MNRLPTAKRVQILNLLVEGMSMRAASRVADVSINTVYKLLEDAGAACAAYHDETVREVHASRIQADELWSFCYAKEKNVPDAKSPPPGAGDVWTWTAIDCDSKLIVSWWVGDRSGATAAAFMKDLRSPLVGRIQLTTDQYTPYPEAAFGADVDYAQLVKAPGERTASTSYVERSNLTIRMGNRRYTRRTNAFSKRITNHCHMLAIYFLYYNFVRIHMSLQCPPAMEAGLTTTLHDMEWIVGLTDAYERRRANCVTTGASMSECRLRARAPRSREIRRCCFSSRTGRRCVPGMGSTVGARWTAPADADIPAHLPGPSTHPFPVLGKAVESALLRKDRCNFRFIPDRLGRRSRTRHRQPPSPPAAASWGRADIGGSGGLPLVRAASHERFGTETPGCLRGTPPPGSTRCPCLSIHLSAV